MAVIFKRNFTLSDLSNEDLIFDKNWKRVFRNGRAIYIATKDNASITINRIVKGKLIPVVLQKFKKGKRVVVVGTAVHNPPHTVKLL
ncbi:hypothetical protein [Paenibacillus hamazuiensis]|uniref:hypothetical protein n=1 Tax=Paenibacillus hamazuiensis TaxID=2936508 RepID=UPI00200FEB97|nr:hypothetical protein [Paenibacillus hamazuiensis]